ncbi:MAG: hypothetical protein IJA89_04545 [Clostridia bacterium]|nr:hypothetical protein [Clostridia bacterium]
MNKMKKTLCLLLATATVGAAFAGCDHDPDPYGDKTVIYVANKDNGIGRVWLDNAIARFEEAKKDVSYEDGMTGVVFEVIEAQDLGLNAMSTSGNNIFFTESSPSVLSLQQSGSILEIDDVVKGEIENKIQPAYREALKGADGKYYAVPHFALHPGLTYNVDLFETEDMFIAAPEQDSAKAEEYDCDYGTVEFALKGADGVYGTADDGKKSCGNDGVYGTYDDGLPTSLVEFLVLCDRMKDAGIEPVSFRPGYEKYLIDALWASLAGAEAANTRYTYKGKLEYVTGFDEDTQLFDGIDYIAKPITETKTITRGEGYLANDNVARYYAAAMMEILETERWISNYAYDGSLTHIDYMFNFVLSGEAGKTKQGMFLEGDYWYNEARDNKVFEDYDKMMQGSKTSADRKLAWMPLPTHVSESVTEGNGREYTMLNDGSNYAYINANISNQPGLVKACKDFLAFCYTDSELAEFTKTTGVYRAAMDYSVDGVLDDMNYFAQSVATCKSAATTSTVNAFKDGLYNSLVLIPTIGGIKYSSYWNAIRHGGYSAQEIFEATRTKKAGWGVENV